MNYCIICGQKTKRPIAALLEHLCPVTLEHRRFYIGTFKAWGLAPVLALISPLFNTLWYWKARKSNLGSQFLALEDVTNVTVDN